MCHPQRLTVWLLAAVLVAAGAVIVVDRAFLAGNETQRPELEQALDGLVRTGNAPGATAYVVGPKGSWSGAAGVADTASGAPMPADARMRIESNSKTWLTALVLQLAHEGKLNVDQTVDHWLPGLLRDKGSAITLRQLMYDNSGLIDDNDVFNGTPKQKAAYLARVHDPRLRSDLLAMAARLRNDPSAQVPALLFIRLAAWQPLVAAPGTEYHHSNIGWNVLGLVAQKAGGKPLPELYRERLFEPLGLHDTAFSPQGPIPGPHARGYGKNGKALVDATASHPVKFADGAIVTTAKDEAEFLRAAMQEKLFPKAAWTELYGSPGGATGCAGQAFSGTGAGNGYRSYVWYDGTGDRVAVLLLNATPPDENGAAEQAVLRLFCAA